MPHNIIEYSSSLEPHIPAIINAVHLGALNSALFDKSDIKTRAIAYQHVSLGTDCEYFIHVNAKILSGRNSEQKTQLSHLMLQALEQLDLRAISLTVEVTDIDKVSYAKQVITA